MAGKRKTTPKRKPVSTATAKSTAGRLTYKMRAFIEAYIANGCNGTQAAITAGYSPHTAGVIAYENLRKPQISAAIEARLAEMKMSANEVLFLLSEEARASMADFITFVELPPLKLEDGTELAVQPRAEINLYKGYQLGKLHLIKKVKQTTRTFGRGKDKVVEDTFEIDIVDAHAARVVLGKHHKVLNDKVEVEHILPPELVELAAQYKLKPSDIFQQMVNILGRAQAAKVNADD